MAGSDGAVTAAFSGRGIAGTDVPQDYRILLPPLPTGTVVYTTVFLHCDISGRPYKIGDFKSGLENAGVLKDLKACGSFQMNHVWMATFHSLASKQKILETKELLVKGKRCLVLDPNKAEVRLKLHWVPCDVPDDAIRKALEPYGRVEGIAREAWHEDGFQGVESTTRAVRLTLKEGVTLEKVPHQLRLVHGTALVIAPGRAPMCLRCRKTGHVRRQCKVPRCELCRRFGHEKEDCIKTYATVTDNGATDELTEHLMDEEEAEVAAGGTAPVSVINNPSPFVLDAAGPANTAPSFAASSQAEPVQAGTAKRQQSTTDNDGTVLPEDTPPSQKRQTTGHDEASYPMEVTPTEKLNPPEDRPEGVEDASADEDNQGMPDHRLKWKAPSQRRHRFDPKPRIPEPRRLKDSQ